MRPEKQSLTKEYIARLNASPFFIVVDYKGLKVSHLTELRRRLTKAGAEIHIVKNSVFRLAAKEAGVPDLNGALAGQLAVVTGKRDISTAAKVVKTFGAEFDRLTDARATAAPTMTSSGSCDAARTGPSVGTRRPGSSRSTTNCARSCWSFKPSARNDKPNLPGRKTALFT